MHVSRMMKFEAVLARLAAVLLGLAFLVEARASAQAGPLGQAVSALQVSHPLPPGWTVKLGKDTGGAMGRTDPDRKTITINPEAIATGLPSVNEAQANLPGVLYIVLLHEWYHANECEGGSAAAGGGGSPPYNTDPRDCGDINLVLGVAAQHCELICAVLYAGNGKIDALCALYKDIRRSHNEGIYTPGGSAAAWVKLGCAGPYPGDIPPCGCCP
jgi:hypothetical protein